MFLNQWLAEKRGRIAALALHLKVTPPFVRRMADGRSPIPLDHCPYIERFTGGAVTCEEQRPDKVEYFRLLRERDELFVQAKLPAARAEPGGVAINCVAAVPQGV